MHLKSITLKGFKSFASPTTLNFEPGVTVVVGPNGSGKSNVVDALSWVMGEQGVKSLRGGKMEDVIFAGTSNRAPLGRAEVSLTIDNTDGALPIDYTEVTISRIMFRSGGSEYSINGSPCRLLDVQELLSDSGIGREMHVIVGQGQLDSILHATADDRRGFIEEAAGVLKHRKRKEKTERKLDSLDDKMSRLSDLLTELRRQLKPLGRQAEVARRAVVIQSDVRDARLRLLADDYSAMTSSLAQEQADEQALREQRQAAESQLLSAEATEAELIAAAERAAPELTKHQEAWFRLSGLHERFRAVVSVSRERLRAAQESKATAAPHTDPRQLEAQAHQLQQEHDGLAAGVRERSAELTAAKAARAAAGASLAEEERRVEDGNRSIAERRERLVRLQGRIATARSRVEAREVEIARLGTVLADAEGREKEATARFTELEREVSGLDSGEADLDSQYEVCRQQQEEAAAEVDRLTERERRLASSRETARARLDALQGAVRSRGGLDEDVLASPLVQGLVREQMHIETGWELAVTSALTDLVDAALVDSLEDALKLHNENPSHSLRLLVAAVPAPEKLQCPGRPVFTAIECDANLAAPLSAALSGSVLANDLAEASDLVAGGAHRAVTRQGHVLSLSGLVTWDDKEASALELSAQVEAAESELQEISAESERIRFALEPAREGLDSSSHQLAEALKALHESDAAMAAAADKLGSLGSAVRSARGEGSRLSEDRKAAQTALTADEQVVADAEQALSRAQEEVDQEPVVTDQREQLGEVVRTAQDREMEVRLALRTEEERAVALANRAAELMAAATRERQAQEEQERARARQERQREIATAVRVVAEVALDNSGRLAQAAEQLRNYLEQQRTDRDQRLGGLRSQIKTLTQELDDLTNSVHRDEMVRTEQRLKIEQLQEKAMEDFGIEPEALVAEYGPEVLVPPSPRAPGDEEDGGPDPEPYPYERGEQERRLRSAERALSLLGKVNPLALEEFSAMAERHKFLSAQLDDLKNSKQDLIGIIQEVNDRMEQVFAEAFADTAVEFEQVFSRLFPGGAGKLILTDPDNILTTGVEVEARPPGKKVKRLSLLSGGERSLTAVAFLVALFRARPSPFYVLDEVEAALDDTNLGRLLEVIEELRQNSQLIVITHQKRTMESADALYGVSMRGDGVSAVISQRLRDAVSA